MCLIGLISAFATLEVAAQKQTPKDKGTAGGKPTCENPAYSTEVLKQEPISETCTEYEIKVSYDGTRTFGLSHYVLGFPCGELKDVSNSEQWQQVWGKDPTTGVYGLKIDNISRFGDCGASSFTVKFTWCSDNTCNKELGIAAYKFGTCVYYDTLSNPVPDPARYQGSLRNRRYCSTRQRGRDGDVRQSRPAPGTAARRAARAVLRY